MSNVDIEIQDGNPGAVGVRAHYAQHCFLAHMDFHIGSGLAGIHDGGNVAYDLHFLGGKYGIWTRKPSPAGSSPSWTARLKAKAKPPSANMRQALRSSAAIQECSHGDFDRSQLFRRTLGLKTHAWKTSAARRHHKQ